MAASSKFATGKYANGVCDVCGVTYRLLELRGTTIRGRRTNILACPICWDLDHPQNFLPDAIHVDAQALRNPRPETFYQSRILRHWLPVDALPLALALGSVEVTTT
jgi:hypothetical protein